MHDKQSPDELLHAIEFAQFVLVLDEEDLPVIAYDARFPAHVELLDRHRSHDEVEQAGARLSAWLRAHAH